MRLNKTAIVFSGLILMALIGGCENPVDGDSSDNQGTGETAEVLLPPTGLMFTDTDDGEGEYGGYLTAGRALYEGNLTGYVLYAGTSCTAKKGSSLAVIDKSVDPLGYYFAENTVFDGDVTHLILHSQNDEAESVLGGIKVFVGSSGYSLPDRGNRVSLEGVLDEFYGTAQIQDLTDMTITPTVETIAPQVVDPATISSTAYPAFEDYESMLIRIENVTVTAMNLNDISDLGVFTVTGGLRIDDRIYDDLENQGYGVDDTFSSITGILARYNGQSILMPRDSSDLIP